MLLISEALTIINNDAPITGSYHNNQYYTIDNITLAMLQSQEAITIKHRYRYQNAPITEAKFISFQHLEIWEKEQSFSSLHTSKLKQTNTMGRANDLIEGMTGWRNEHHQQHHWLIAHLMRISNSNHLKTQLTWLCIALALTLMFVFLVINLQFKSSLRPYRIGASPSTTTTIYHHSLQTFAKFNWIVFKFLL